jgi:RNA polymerase sigma factor (sigma-70 family)
MAEPPRVHATLLYHFCRLRLPGVALPRAAFERHLVRGHALAQRKRPLSWDLFVESLHALDWFLACACLEGQKEAWEALFSARANRTDALLVDALRARAVRLFPRDPERQDEAVSEFWGYLLAGQREGSAAILARYDGQRPLVPWLIRVFQNKHLSDMRSQKGLVPLPDDGLGDADLELPDQHDARWHEQFRDTARQWFAGLTDREVLLLGLRLRYRLSQREVAQVLRINEGNVSRQIDRLRDRCLESIGQQMRELGWVGDDLTGFVMKEMDSVLLDEPRLSADRLAALLAVRGGTQGGKAEGN